MDANLTRGRVGLNTGLRVDAQQRLGDRLRAAAAGHVRNVETKHRDLLVAKCPNSVGFDSVAKSSAYQRFLYFCSMANLLSQVERTEKG